MTLNRNENIMYQILKGMIEGIGVNYKIEVDNYLKHIKTASNYNKYTYMTVTDLINDIKNFNSKNTNKDNEDLILQMQNTILKQQKQIQRLQEQIKSIKSILQ